MKLSLKVKSKMSFFSERQSYFKEKTTACLHSCEGLAICERRVNLNFLALPKKFDFNLFLWEFALKVAR